MAQARLTLLPAQRELDVEQDETLLDAALRAGVNLPHSCKAGHCASCRAQLIKGEIRYPGELPLGLTRDEHARGYVLLCQARAASARLAVQVREIRPPVEVQVKSLPCRVERLEPLTADVMAVFLKPPSTEAFTYLPGQYLDILLPQQRRRSFSIANAPEPSGLIELHIGRVAKGEFSRQVFEAMRPGALLRMEGPLGQFWFRHESPRPALFIAGGTGYAPVRAMLQSLLGAGEGRPLHLYRGVRTADQLYETAQLQAWVERFSNFHYTPVVSNEAPGWSGYRGLVHAAVLQDHPNLAAFDVYAAGPPALVEAIRQTFTERGLPAEQLFFDSFDFAPDTLAKLGSREERS